MSGHTNKRDPNLLDHYNQLNQLDDCNHSNDAHESHLVREFRGNEVTFILTYLHKIGTINSRKENPSFKKLKESRVSTPCSQRLGVVLRYEPGP